MEAERIIIIIVAVAFGSLAAIMAYLISYEVYLHHFPDKRDAKRLAREMAFSVLLFFVGLGMVLALILPLFLK